jgi:glutamyl-tRNA synthetase
MSVRVRYAPSPTGSPHVGNVRTAIFNWLFARRHDGVFIARLEDTDRDPERYKPDSIGDIEHSLRHLGIEPDEWWVSGGPAAPYVQSERLDLYKQAAEELIAKGHAYKCYCTPERLAEMRAEQQARGGSSGYDRRCRGLTPEEKSEEEAQGLPYTVRLAVPLDGQTTYHDLVYGDIAFENRLIDDQVLLKSNGWPTYHLAVVVDDHHMGITHVLRGEDWQPSTPKQILLYQMLGWEAPQWAHLPLIVGTDRKKLSKRHGSTQFVEFIHAGYLPEALFNFLILLGWSAGDEDRELFTREEIVERFEIGGITNHPAIFDYEKLRWMNGEYIRSSSVERITDLSLPYLQEAGLISTPPTQEERSYTANVIPLIIERIKVLDEAAPSVEFFFVDPEQPEEKGRRKWLTGPRAMELLNHSIAVFTAYQGELTVEGAEVATNAVAEAGGTERGPVIHTLRIATTGRTVGPGLFETLAVLGKGRILQRLERAKTWVAEA